jgi:tetratricopeptide (TPR) repeat protein
MIAGTVRKRGRRVFLALLLAAAVALAGVGGWYGWRVYHEPDVPEIDLTDADPEVAVAVEAARERAAADAYSVRAWGDLGKLLRALRYEEEAAACFAVAEQLEPGEVRWPYLRGEALLLRGDTEAALPHLARAAALSRDEPAPHLRLGEVLLARGEYDGAEAAFRAALDADDRQPAARLGLGLAAYARDDREAARAHLRRCEHSPFTQQRACARLAALFQREGDAAKAASYDRRARSLQPDAAWPDPFVLECLQAAVGRPARFQYVQQMEAQRRYRDAVAVLREMVEERPDAQVYAGLADDLGALGDQRGSEEAARQALRLAPESVQAHYLLARSLWAQAEQAEGEAARAGYRAALAAAGEALARKPDHAQGHLLRGRCLRRLGERAEGLAALRRAAQCGPHLADAHLQLGEALAEDGQTAEARTHLGHAVELSPPDDPRPRQALERLGRPGGGDDKK